MRSSVIRTIPYIAQGSKGPDTIFVVDFYEDNKKVSTQEFVDKSIHYAESESYYRTIRLATISPLVQILADAGYRIEPAVSDPVRTVVVYFPVLHEAGTVAKTSVSIWEQFANAVDLQEYWADNQVSITITFREEEKSQIARALSAFDRKLKGVSLLPISDHGYKQAPYTAAPREEIEKYSSTLFDLDFSSLTNEGEDADANKFCDSAGCEI